MHPKQTSFYFAPKRQLDLFSFDFFHIYHLLINMSENVKRQDVEYIIKINEEPNSIVEFTQFWSICKINSKAIFRPFQTLHFLA